jgi:glyceraldehyde 3-phosphate dehydrogenase
MTKARVAINGFGRIGRLFFRQAFEASDLEIVAINDLGDVENLAYLLKYDSVYGRYGKEIKTENGKLIVDGKEINFIQVKDPALLPWKDMQIDIVVESTGLFDSYASSKIHLTAGAKRVVITAPAKDADGPDGQTVLMGVNEDNAKTCLITSNGSCTTNSSSPVIQVLSETIGIQKAMLATVHAYTATQALVDGPIRPGGGKDFRKGRAAAHNTVPETTGAAISVARAIPDVKGKFDGISFRVPNITGSISSITLLAKRATTVEEIQKILSDAAASPRWQGIMKVTNDQLVSSDIVGEPYGAIVPLDLIKVVDGDMVNVLSWYDNEAGYVSTLIKHVEKVAGIL